MPKGGVLPRRNKSKTNQESSSIQAPPFHMSTWAPPPGCIKCPPLSPQTKF